MRSTRIEWVGSIEMSYKIGYFDQTLNSNLLFSKFD